MYEVRRQTGPAMAENPETMKPTIKVSRILDSGLEFGHGAISSQDDPEILSLVDKIIHESPDILVPVDKDDSGRIIDDDGCGDGRAVARVFTREAEFKRSLNRPKVFGGAVTMAVAARIGLGQAAEKPLHQVFSEAMTSLQRAGIDFGAHTDDRASGTNCGCGAIDRAPEAIQAALEYENPIRRAIALLGVSDDGLDKVYGNFRRYAATLPAAANAGYSGREVMSGILNSATRPVVKQLAGPHQERRIVLNHAAGYTVNQRLIREATANRAQVFAVDVWRLNDIALNLHKGQPERQHKVLLSELVYTLSIAAVLTKGDLPVDMIEAEADWSLIAN